MNANLLWIRSGLLTGCAWCLILVCAARAQTGSRVDPGAARDTGASSPATALTIGTIAQEGYLKASDVDYEDFFGRALAISGDTVVVGVPWDDSAATGVDGDAQDDSAPYAGAVYVYVRSGASWSQQAYLKASNTGAADEFGGSVAISGDTIVVGAKLEASNATGVDGDEADDSRVKAGAAYVFVRDGGTWSQEAYLKASNTDARDRFGSAVAVSGDTIVVGASGEMSRDTGVDGDQNDNNAPSAGAAYMFVRSGGSWTQQAYLKASNTQPGGDGDSFGARLALSGDTVVVGAWGEDSGATGVDGDQDDDSAESAGAAYVFVRSGATWSQQAYLKASNTDVYDHFAISVALSDDTIVVGAFLEDSATAGVDGDGDDDSASQAGAAYVFVRSGTTWSQEAYLKASNTDALDWFGVSVAVSGDTAAVGAYGEDGSSTGVQGDESLDDASDAGAVYVFTRSGTSWSQAAYVKASNTDPDDLFGNRVALFADTLAVAASSESSAGTGVNGMQCDNSIFDSGAAYVFDLDATDPGPRSFCAAKRGSGGCVPFLCTAGTPTLTGADDFFVHAHEVTGETVGFLLLGLDRNPFPMNGPGGIRGLHGPSARGARYCVLRPAVVGNEASGGSAGMCDGLLAFHLSQVQMATRGLVTGAEALVQVVYRDPAHPDGSGVGHTEGLAFTLLP